jgi:hypothetical protein
MIESMSKLQPVSDLFTYVKDDAKQLNKPYIEIVAKIILDHRLSIRYEAPMRGTLELSLFINAICWREEDPQDTVQFCISVADYKMLKRCFKIHELMNE